MSIAISTHVWKHSRQKGTALLVLLALADMANSSGEAWPGLAYLAERCRMTKRNVQKIINQLVSADELQVITSGGAKTPYGSTNRYFIPLKGVNAVTPDERGDTPQVNFSAEGGERGDTPQVNAVTPKSSIETSLMQPLFETTTPAIRVGAVAVFKQLPEYEQSMDMQRPQAAEARPGNEQFDQADDANTTPPLPLPEHREGVEAPHYLVKFFTGCTPHEVADMVARYGEPTLQNAKMFAESSAGVKNPPGYVRAKLAQGWRPPERKPVFGEPGYYTSGEFADFVMS